MTESFEAIQTGRERQRLRDRVVHGWYQFVLGYPDHLVPEMLERFGASSDSVVLDPFCGTGTTLVECKKMGIASVGIDANPASVLASQVKTDWDLDPDLVEELGRQVMAQVRPVSDAFLLSNTPLFGGDGDLESLRASLVAQCPGGKYLLRSGMVERQWK
jgi:hypothetical protein